jgi:hypothetical protein
MMKIKAQGTGKVGSNIIRDSKVSFMVGENEFCGAHE